MKPDNPYRAGAMNPLPPLLAALAAATLLSGCSGSAANTVAPAHSNTRADDVLIEKTSIDPGLSSRVSVEGVQVARDVRLRRVAANVRNKTRDATFFQYRFRWLDKNGIEVDTPLDDWQAANLIGGDTTQLVGIAPHAAAVDWTLAIRGDGK